MLKGMRESNATVSSDGQVRVYVCCRVVVACAHIAQAFAHSRARAPFLALDDSIHAYLRSSSPASHYDMCQRHMLHDDSAVTIFFGLTVLASPDDHHADLAYIDSLPSPGACACACACAPSRSTELMIRLSCLSASLPLAWSLYACLQIRPPSTAPLSIYWPTHQQG